MSHPWEQSSSDVAAAAETERAGLAHTLDQLRENLQPRNVVDEVMSHAGVNRVNVSDQLVNFAKTNPIAAALIGIGAAMFFGTKRAGSGTAAPRQVRTAATRYRSGTSPDPRFNSDGHRDVPGRYDPDFTLAPDETNGLGRARIADRMMGEARETRPLNVVSVFKHPRSGLPRLIDEQPLVLAALGVAVGAAIGSAFPTTALESQLMGDANEAVRQNASAAAQSQLAQLKSTATQTFEQMKATVAEHGATSENLSGLVHDLGDDVRAASQSIGPRAAGSRSSI